jgi:hypothetical protein
MTPLDRAILELSRDEFRALKPLLDRFPQGSVYRHVTRFLSLGWLQKEGSRYKTTDAGRRQLIEAQSHRQWDTLVTLFSPLGLVPTAVHRALAQLIFAAVAIRQQGTRPDRHPVFVCAGGTLRWKTSLGLFICYALGLDPAVHLIDCAAESGKSLGIRRNSTGATVFKREVLTASFITLDEFLTADPGVRSTLRLFLSGRLQMPFENESLTISPVPLLTLNPQDKPTLEGRLGLSAPQIRRAIVADLDAVRMPDLAAIGDEALTAARAHAPLVIPSPTVDCRAYHQQILALTRAILLPEAEERVDVHLVENLCSGMTAFIPDPNEAIAEVGHALATVLETLGWTRPDWVTAVSHFSLHPVRHPPIAVPPMPLKTMPDTEAVHEVIPIRRRIMHDPESNSSPYTMSEESRARLIIMAAEEQTSFTQALDVVTDYYHSSMKSLGRDLHDLHSILALSKDLKVRELSVAHVKITLELLAYLEEYQLEFEAFEPAVHLLQRLQEFGLTSAPAPDVTRILDVAYELVTRGLSPLQMEQWLAQRTTETEG